MEYIREEEKKKKKKKVLYIRRTTSYLLELKPCIELFSPKWKCKNCDNGLFSVHASIMIIGNHVSIICGPVFYLNEETQHFTFTVGVCTVMS